MLELYDAAFSGLNIVYTGLLLLILVYWGIVLLGVVDLDTLDLDLDADAGVDVDADGDVGGSEGAGGFSWLAYFNVGEVPVMLYLTVVAVVMWVISLQTHNAIDHYGANWMKAHQGWLAAALAVPNVVFGLFVAKAVTTPLKRMRQRKVFRTRLEGKSAIVTSLNVTDRYGRCELTPEDGSLVLNIRAGDNAELTKGDRVVLVEQICEGDEEYYVVVKERDSA